MLLVNLAKKLGAEETSKGRMGSSCYKGIFPPFFLP